MIVHRQTSLRARGGSRSEVSAMGDRRKCRTYAASPAEPGGLPVMLEMRMQIFEEHLDAPKLLGEGK